MRDGAGGFDDVVVIFSGSPDAPEAFIRIREVKDYPNRYVPLEEFSAIRPPNLVANLRALEQQIANSLIERTRGVASTQHQELTPRQLMAVRDALNARKLRVEVVLGPSTKLGDEMLPGATVLRSLRAEVRDALDVDVLAQDGSGHGIADERISAEHVATASTFAAGAAP